MTEFLSQYHLTGLAIGLATFLVIGLFHPVVIKCHYYFGTRCRWWFLLLGLVACGASIVISSTFWSAVVAVVAFSSFWTIKKYSSRRSEWPADGFRPIRAGLPSAPPTIKITCQP